MSKYFAKINWSRDPQSPFIDNKYSRGHKWSFDGGVSIEASSSPHIVPLPYSVEESVDPEEAFIASLSSCHMLFFLSIAAKNKVVVNNYTDNAEGVMTKDPEGKLAITTVTLKPYVEFNNDKVPSRALVEKMHHQAHEQCFIANSVKAEVIIEIVT